MDYSKKYLQILIVTVVMALGITAGASINVYAQASPEISTNTIDCGRCDRADQMDLTFCNFDHNFGECAGNDGGPCGGVGCW